MDELTFLLILAGIGIVLLVAMFTYYRHHKKIHDEIQEFNRHPDLDDVLLDEKKYPSFYHNPLSDDELPSSFVTTRDDNLEIDGVFSSSQPEKVANITHVSTDSVSTDSVSTSSVNVNTVSMPRDAAAVSSKHASKHASEHASEHDTEHPPVSNNIAESAQEQSETEMYTTETGTTKTGTTESRTIRDETAATEIKTAAAAKSAVTKAVPAETFEAPLAQHPEKTKKPSQLIEVICEPLPRGVDDLILSFTIVSYGEKFTGPHLYKALEDSGLRFGEMNIFHYPGDKKPHTYALFSVANLVEPGTFELHGLEQFSTPGISLFMRLPTRKSVFIAFDEFLQVSRLLSQKLGGELCDGARNQLTQQSISHKKEQIKKLQFELTKAKKIAELSK